MKRPREFRKDLKNELKDREFKRQFDKEEIFSSVAIRIAQLRKKNRLTQTELARNLGTTQQTISRLESANNEMVSLSTLVKIAQRFEKRLVVRFV